MISTKNITHTSSHHHQQQQQPIFKLNIFERSVDPFIIDHNNNNSNNNNQKNNQIFENSNQIHHNLVINSLSPLSKQNSPSSSSSCHHLIENYIPTCLDATTEILSNSKIDLESVNVLSPINTRRLSTSLLPSCCSSSSCSMSPRQKQQQQQQQQQGNRTNSISRRLSETYFRKKHSQSVSNAAINSTTVKDGYDDDDDDDDKVATVVPFYSYYDLVNSEKLVKSRHSSVSDDDISYINDSNLDDFFSDDGKFISSDIDELSNSGNGTMIDYDEGFDDEDEDEEPLSVCSISDLLRCKTSELRGKY